MELIKLNRIRGGTEMLDYRRMSSIFNTEYIPCGNISLRELEKPLVQQFGNANLPIGIEYSKIKAGLLTKDECLVIYNPQNLDYHTIILVIRELNSSRVISMYSAGTASMEHFGGGIFNVDHQYNKLKSVFKSSKQKQAEEMEYNSKAFGCVYNVLAQYGILAD